MGEVFEAWDRQRDEVVALKTLARVDADTLARFKREFRTLQGLAHPNLVSLRELVREGDQWFFTMELVAGTHLLDWVRPVADGKRPSGRRAPTGGFSTRRLDEARVRDAFAQLAHGLRALHHAGKIHRDIKPSNVMVARDGRVVLLDFGLVTELDPGQQSIDGRPIGTVDYMAPEQASGRPISEAADWYAFGVMLHEALTGRVPFSGHVLQILVEKQQRVPTPVAELVPDVPADLAALCDALLAIEPAGRPSADEIARRLGVDQAELRRTSSLGPPAPGAAFYGRDGQLAELARSWARAETGAIVHLVTGQSGIGKSTLVSHFVADVAAADPTLLALHARCYERETVPYKALDGIADDLADDLGALPDAEVAGLLPPQPSLLARLFPVFQQVAAIAAAPAAADSKDPLEQRRRMFHALRHLLAARATTRRVLLTIDDLQWADADSFLLLRELLRAPAAPPVLVIATVRTGDELPAAVKDGLAGLVVESLGLGPLDDADSRRLAVELSPRVGSRADLDQLMHDAGGHPLFLQELVRYVDSVGAIASTPTLDDALRARVEVLGVDARHLLELVCVAGGPIAGDVAVRACRIDPQRLDRAIATLKVAGLAREVGRGRGLALEPYHDRVREAVTDGLAPEDQRALHARLAAALEATADRDPHLLHRHYRLAGMTARAAECAEIAAARSVAAHAFEQAAELWRDALELVAHDADDTRRLHLRLGEALGAAGRGAEAAEHYLAAAAGADPATRLECQRHAAQQLLYSGRIERGLAVLSDLLAQIGVSVAATPKKALASLLWHRALLRLRGLGFRPRHRREIADATLMKLEALHGAAIGLATVDTIRGTDYQARALILALRTGSRFEISRALVFEGMFQATNARVAAAARMFARAAEAAEGLDEPYLSAILEAGPGVAAYFDGRLEESIALLERGEAIVRQLPGVSWELVSIRIFWLWALRFLGDYHRLRERVEQFLRDAQVRGDQYLESTIRRSCAVLAFADDRPERVAPELARATWAPPTDAFHVQHFHEWIALGELALYTGAPVDPRVPAMRDQLERSLLMRVTSIQIQAAFLEARLILADRDADPAAARRHVRALRKAPQRIATVWAPMVAAGIAARLGDRAAAARALAEAEAAAAALGVKSFAATVAYRAAQLAGDEAGRAAAAATLAELGVVAPAKLVNLFAPGFDA